MKARRTMLLAIFIPRPSRRSGNVTWAKEFFPYLIFVTAASVAAKETSISLTPPYDYMREMHEVYIAISKEQSSNYSSQ